MREDQINDEPTVRMTRAELVAGTRQRIVGGAHHLLLEQQYEEVTLAGIAAAANVSHQTVLNHFESKDGVILAVLDLFQEETAAVLSQTPPGDVRAAVKSLVGTYERWGDIMVGWLNSNQSAAGGEQATAEEREHHQHWLTAVFADSLPAGVAARRRVLAGLTVATDVHVWKLLRRDMHRSRAATEGVMSDLIHGVLKGPYSE